MQPRGTASSTPSGEAVRAVGCLPAWLASEGDPRLDHWLAERAAEADARLGSAPEVAALAARLREALDRTDRIPPVSERASMLYNFWTDAEHPRGLWRRATWESYILGSPSRADRDPVPTHWEELLDLDRLSEEQGRRLTWRGAQVVTHGPLAGRRAIVTVSDGGSDAAEAFEVELPSGRRVTADDGGFTRPTSKGSLTWGDLEGGSVLLRDGTDPAVLSPAGFPRQVRRRRRGAAAEEDEVLVTASAGALAAFAAVDDWGRTWLTTMPSFSRTRVWLLPDGADVPRGPGVAAEQLADGGEHVPPGALRLDVPESCSAGVGCEWLTMELRESWELDGTVHAPGTLLAAPLGAWLRGERHVSVLFVPDRATSLASALWTRDHLVLTVLDDVVERLEVHTPPRDPEGSWERHWIDLTGASDRPRSNEADPSALRPGRALLSVSAHAVDAGRTNYLWISATGWTTPSSLSVGRVTQAGAIEGMTVVRQAPARYDARGVRVGQHVAVSADGTRVPYFEIGRPVAGARPTLVQSYGAFGRSLGPQYDPVVGRGWLERGGTLVVAGLRGGGEYGPSWHAAARGSGRYRVREDLLAVVRSLHERGVAGPKTTVLSSSSAGGIAVGSALVEEPGLLAGVVLQAPLLDLERYSGLLAGASWLSEIGDPTDPEQWEWMEGISPLHGVRQDRDYPPVLLVESRTDDRVHPWHARAMTEVLRRAGARPLLVETVEGGHRVAATSEGVARANALVLEFAWRCATA